MGGGIAAYKAAELVRELSKAGAEVRVVMTAAAQKFITPLTLQTLSHHPVGVDTFDLQQESTISHIDLADRSELFVVAPATADLVARLALGMANDLLTTVALACRAPLVLAPSMNVNMWQHPATQVHIQTLRGRGVRMIGPDAGDLACGWVGAGRMAEPSEIAAGCATVLGETQTVTQDWAGLSVLVTAGSTREAIDPVRFIGNRSTGKMGFAIAKAAAARGAKVVLISGPSELATPAGVERINIESAVEMRDAVMSRADVQSAIFKAAAVADHRPAQVALQKIKKQGAASSLELQANPDILAELGVRKFGRVRPVLVGFAAETTDVERHAREKLARKHCDLIVANDVSEAGSGFGTDTNRVMLVSEGGVDRLPLLSKDEVAHRLLDRVRSLVKSA